MFGIELKERIANKQDVVSIGAWAHTIFIDYDLDSDFDDLLLTLSTMELGSEFERSYEELDKIADDLIAGKNVKL